MSAISYIYSQIKTQLETVVGIGYVGKWNNQLENDSRERQFKYPCVLIEFGSVEWLNTDQRPSMINTNYQQKGLVEITVHTLFKSVDNSTDTFESHIDFCKLIWDALTNFQDTGEGFTPLQRVRDIDDSSHDVVRDWQTVYSSMIFEAPNSQNLIDAAPVSISITAEYTPDTGTPIVLPICAEADVYLNDSPIWTVASGDILELSIVNQDDVSVAPISVVGDVIKISDTGGACVPATAVLKDSAGVTISTINIDSGDSEDITAPNGTITYNDGNALATVKSNGSVDIDFEYQNGSTATPTSVVGTLITFPNPLLFDPTDLVSYYVLNWVNPFGNNSRFTDTLGGQTYANALIIDWKTYRPFAGTVLMWWNDSNANNRANAEAALPSLNVAGFTGGWQIASLEQHFNQYQPGAGDYPQSPFSFTLALGQVRTSTENTAGTAIFRMSVAMGTTNDIQSALYSNMVNRWTTLAELGL